MSNENTTEGQATEVNNAAPTAVEAPKVQNPWVRAGMTVLKVMGICGVSYVSYKVGQASVTVKAQQAAASASAAQAHIETPQSI